MFETGEMRDMRDEMGMRCGMKGGGRGKVAPRKNTRIITTVYIDSTHIVNNTCYSTLLL